MEKSTEQGKYMCIFELFEYILALQKHACIWTIAGQMPARKMHFMYTKYLCDTVIKNQPVHFEGFVIV